MLKGKAISLRFKGAIACRTGIRFHYRDLWVTICTRFSGNQGAKLLELIGDISVELGNGPEALTHYQKADHIFGRVGHPSEDHRTDLANKLRKCTLDA